MKEGGCPEGVDSLSILVNILLIVIAVFLFAFVIFFHEFGHFFTAKLCKIKVNEFAIGMGPKIFRRTKGETSYSLRLLPIGGYCAMEGEDEASEDEHAFGNRPLWQRMLVIVAGAVMNIILGLLMMAVILSTQKEFATTTISAFDAGSALEEAGLMVGDRVMKIDDFTIYNARDLSFGLGMADPAHMEITVEREGKPLTLTDIRLRTTTLENGRTEVKQDFYVMPGHRTLGNVLTRSVSETYSMMRMVFESLKGIVNGRFGLKDLAGPVGTAQIIAEAASSGLMDGFGEAVMNILMVMILVTVNLGIVNLLPIPALDGGRLLFLLYELIFRKPVPPKYEGWIHTAGFVLLMLLMVVVAFHDIVRLVTGGAVGA